MLNTIYGVDIKIPPEGAPRIIEINGVDFGTDFYKMPDSGEHYYRTAAKELGKAARGRPVYIESDWCRGLSIRRTYAANDCKQAIKIKTTAPDWRLLPFEQSWVEQLEQDRAAFQAEKRSEIYPPEPRYYLAAARAQGIDARVFENARAEDDCLQFDTLCGRWQPVIDAVDVRVQIESNRPSQIGLVWANQPTLRKLVGFMRSPSAKFLNTPILEYILENKSALYSYLDKAPALYAAGRNGDFGRIYPRTFVHAPGVSDPEALADFVSSLPGELAVVKPSDENCGIGARILPKNKLLEEIAGAKRKKPLYNTLVGLNHPLFIVQQFIPGKPVRAEQDGRFHDGCIRAVVISGKYVGGQWRLAPKPMRSRADHISRYRCNLSRGAFAQYLNERDETMVAGFAEEAVAAFEQSVMPVITKPWEHIYLFITKPYDLSDNLARTRSRLTFAPWEELCRTADPRKIERLLRKLCWDVCMERAPKSL
ncbi:hypothetical protein HY642_05400 [Candidatus Woesearchaeota archaeon]|nr:hypothetical protein [Candidatus Woesearchaeota archaeon]